MKKIFIALLLVIITISTVSAADDNLISDNLTNSQNSNIQLSNINENNGEAISLEDGETLSHNSTGTHDPDIQLSCYQNEILKNQNLIVIYSTSNYEDITGNLSCYIDDEFLESIDLTNSYPQSLFLM